MYILSSVPGPNKVIEWILENKGWCWGDRGWWSAQEYVACDRTKAVARKESKWKIQPELPPMLLSKLEWDLHLLISAHYIYFSGVNRRLKPNSLKTYNSETDFQQGIMCFVPKTCHAIVWRSDIFQFCGMLAMFHRIWSHQADQCQLRWGIMSY